MQIQERIFSKVEIITTLLLSGLFMLLFNIDVFIRYLSGQDSVSYNYFNDKLQGYIDVPVDWLSDNLFTASITTFLLWAVFGIICYSVLYFFIDVKSEVSETLEIGDSYMHPTYEKQSTYKNLLFKNTLILLGTTALLILVITLALNVFVPFMSTNILLSLYESGNFFSTIWNILQAYVAVVIIPISVLAIIKVNKILRVKTKI